MIWLRTYHYHLGKTLKILCLQQHWVVSTSSSTFSGYATRTRQILGRCSSVAEHAIARKVFIVGSLDQSWSAPRIFLLPGGLKFKSLQNSHDSPFPSNTVQRGRASVAPSRNWCWISISTCHDYSASRHNKFILLYCMYYYCICQFDLPSVVNKTLVKNKTLHDFPSFKFTMSCCNLGFLDAWVDLNLIHHFEIWQSAELLLHSLYRVSGEYS